MGSTRPRKADYPSAGRLLQSECHRFTPPPFTADISPLLFRIRRRDPLASDALLYLSRKEPEATWQLIRAVARALDEADGATQQQGGE